MHLEAMHLDGVGSRGHGLPLVRQLARLRRRHDLRFQHRQLHIFAAELLPDSGQAAVLFQVYKPLLLQPNLQNT
jgi:hypothetical protein